VPATFVTDFFCHIFRDIFLILEHIMGKLHHSRPLTGEFVAFPGEVDRFCCPVEDGLFLMLWEVVIGDLGVDAVLLTEGVQKLGVVALVKAVHDFDGSLVDTEGSLDDLFEVDGIADTQSITDRAGSLGGVEREAYRL
jgi:hypothetical protein